MLDEGLARWIYRDGRVEMHCRHDGLADSFIDGQYFGEVSPFAGRGQAELERRIHDGWHGFRVRFYPDETWRRTSEGVLARTTLLLRTAMTA
jgi:hypothetical protein